MRIILDLHVSSGTLALAERAARRQKAAMEAHYNDMVMAGKIGGAEAERRLLAQNVIVQAMSDLARLVAQEERASAMFGPGDDGEGNR